MKRTLRLALMSMTLITLFWARESLAQNLTKLPNHTWMGVYIGQNKIGYMHLCVDKDKFEGKDVYRIDSTVRTRITLLGSKIQQDVITTLYADEKFAPIFEIFKMSSGGRSTSVEARFTPKEVQCKLISDGTTSNKTVPIPEGSNLVGDSVYGLGTNTMKVGDSVRMSYFNPLTITIDDMTLTALRREKVEVKGRVYDSLVVQNQTPMGDMTTWQLDNGDPVKIEAIMGMVMLRETQEEALADEARDYTPPDDLAVLTSVKVNRDIPNSNQLKEMKIKLVGIEDKNLIKNDKRQQVTYAAEKKTASYKITASTFSSAKAAKLPISGEGYADLLAHTPYVQAGDEAIKSKAKEIVGSETNAYKAAAKIRAWVHKTMVPQTDIGIARSAVDVLNKPVGVCRDYAILYTALARAAGIPTRVVAGLVYMNGGFYYHAWAESFVGEWVPFDATLKTDFVDATHIKLTEGDATSMFEMARVIGRLKAEVLEYK